MVKVREPTGAWYIWYITFNTHVPFGPARDLFRPLDDAIDGLLQTLSCQGQLLGARSASSVA